MNENGVVYIGIGLPYLALAFSSFESLRRFHPDIPVVIYTDHVSFSKVKRFPNMWASFDRLYVVDLTPKNNRFGKVSLFDWSPFAKTLFLDADTEVVSAITDIFEYLDYFDFAVRLYYSGLKSSLKAKRRVSLLGEKWTSGSMPHWNSGVFAFRKCSNVEYLFQLWRDYLSNHSDKGIRSDQGALVEAIFRSPVRVLSLDARWNCLTTERAYFTCDENRILHNCYMGRLDFSSFYRCLELYFERPSGISLDSLNKFVLQQKKKKYRKMLRYFRLKLSHYVSPVDWV